MMGKHSHCAIMIATAATAVVGLVICGLVYAYTMLHHAQTQPQCPEPPPCPRVMLGPL